MNGRRSLCAAIAAFFAVVAALPMGPGFMESVGFAALTAAFVLGACWGKST